MGVITTKNLEETGVFAEELLQRIVSQPRKNHATVVGLSGDLGAGKTALVKTIARVAGISEVITSPTFVLEKIYPIPHGSLLGNYFSQLVHIDAYRLSSEDEMSVLGWDTLCADPANIIFLEWPEQVARAMPNDMIQVSFEHVDEGVRKISYN